MSDVQQGPGWWLASDGKWYPPESRAQPMPPPPMTTPPGGAGPTPVVYVAPVQRRSVSTGLGGTIQGFFWAIAGLSAVTVFVAIGSLVTFNNYWDTPINSRAEASAYDDWVSADDALAGAAALVFLTWFVIWILLMVWMNGAHKTTQQLWHGERRWTSGWTVGSWFIPFANAVLPKLVLSEIELIARAPRTNGVVRDASWKNRPTLMIGKLWWLGFVIGTVLNGVGNSVGDDFDASDGEIRASYALNTVGFVLIAASGVFGALYIRRLGSRLSASGLDEPT